MKYLTVANVMFGVGALLGLSEALAAPRRMSLTPVPDRKDWYTTTAPIHLKRGETFLSDDDLPKSMVDLVDFEGKADEKVQTSARKKKAELKRTAPEGDSPTGDNGAGAPPVGGADGEQAAA